MTRGTQKVLVIETQVDDMNPQLFEPVMERLFKAGALDVTLTPVIMKKTRPGILITVLTPPGRDESAVEILLEETSTLGVRITEAVRRTLDREWVTVSTRYGRIRIKIGRLNGRIMNAAPEYEDCLTAARKRKVSVKAVMDEAAQKYRAKQN